MRVLETGKKETRAEIGWLLHREAVNGIHYFMEGKNRCSRVRMWHNVPPVEETRARKQQCKIDEERMRTSGSAGS